MKKIARRNFLKLVGVSASIPILQSLPIASASATDLSDYPLLKDGIFDFENTDITQYVDDVQEVFGSEKDMIEEITVKTTSMLGDEKPYATFGTGRHFVTRPATAGMTGSVKIGDFKLSSDINKVIVKSSSLQAYNLTKATWQSSIEFSGMVWVK